MPRQGLSQDVVLRAAVDLIEEGGLPHFSMGELARRLQVKPASLYNHVESLEQLLTLVGDQWVPAIKYLRILCLSGLFMPLMICSANILNANGRSDTTLYLEIMKTALAVIPVLAGIFSGMEALLWATVAVSAASYLVYAAMVSRSVDYPVLRQLSDIAPYFIVSAVMAAAVWLLSWLPLQTKQEPLL